MSILNNASQPIVHGGQFTNVLHGDAHFHVGDAKFNSDRSLDLLRQNVATGAFYDAAERGDPPKCHPKTRLAILAEVQKWVRDPEVCKGFVIWLYGPAGAGKSAIAQTLAELFAMESILVASFFFSRTGTGRNDTTRFITSIAYQLSLSIPGVRAHIAIAVEHDPLIFTRSLLSQMHALIIKPLNAAAANLSSLQPRLVIIDGLDEARGETTQKELLEVLGVAIQQLHTPLIFFVSSRPETVIRQAFDRQPLQSLMQGLALDEDYRPDNDIRTLLFAKFNEIRELHPSGKVLPESWPSQDDVDYLVLKASGQFIYASTIVKYINSPRDNPKKQLKIILGLSDPGKETPFAQLDTLYCHILSSVKDISKVLEILALVFLPTSYGRYLSIDFIETLLGYESGDVTAALTDMHALIHVPSYDGDTNGRLRMYHASLHEFLMDKSRSGRFFLNPKIRHAELARRLFRYISTAPKSEYEGQYKEKRFSAILNGFIFHYLTVSHVDELVADMENFSLTGFLSNIPLDLFYQTLWDTFFDHLQSECNRSNMDLYRRLRDEFDTWIRNRYQQYPEFIQNIIPAAYAIPGSYTSIFRYLPDIFDILMHSLPPADAICLEELDRQLFRFQDRWLPNYLNSNGRAPLQNFFTDPSRAGVHFADKFKFGKLAEEIVKGLCRRGEGRSWTLQIFDRDLEFFPKILGAAAEDARLAQLLWELTVHYEDGDNHVVYGRRELMDNACLDYIKRCGIAIPEHVHQAGCTICADYKPIFPTTLPEIEKETTNDAIFTADGLDASHSANPISALPHISPQSPIPSVVVPSCSSPPRSSDISYSPAQSATCDRLTNATSSSSSFSPVTRRSTHTRTCPSSAGPSTSSHYRNSSSLPATSRGRTIIPAPVSSTRYFSPKSPSASGITRRSMSGLSQQKGNYYGQSLASNNTVSGEGLSLPPSKKIAPEKPAWK